MSPIWIIRFHLINVNVNFKVEFLRLSAISENECIGGQSVFANIGDYAIIRVTDGRHPRDMEYGVCWKYLVITVNRFEIH